MNSLNRLAAVLLVAIAPACSTPGYQKSESAAAAARAAKGAAAGFEKQTQLCLDSMATLFTEPYQDLAARFERFSRNVGGLTSANTKLASSVSAFERATDARFRAWDAENATFTDRDFRTHAEARRDTVFGTWAKARGPMDLGVARAGAVTSDFAGLRKLLSNDLTPAGVGSATSLAEKVRSEADKVLDVTRAWSDGLDDAIEALSTGPTSPPAK